MAKTVLVPEAPEGAKYPLLYKPRHTVVGASNDARWRNISSQVDIIDCNDVHRLQLRAAHFEQARRMATKQKAKSKRSE